MGEAMISAKTELRASGTQKKHCTIRILVYASSAPPRRWTRPCLFWLSSSIAHAFFVQVKNYRVYGNRADYCSALHTLGFTKPVGQRITEISNGYKSARFRLFLTSSRFRQFSSLAVILRKHVSQLVQDSSMHS